MPDRRRVLVELVPQSKSVLQRVSGVTPIFLSILAITLSIWSSVETRRHNRLSVKPDVNFLRVAVGTPGRDVGVFRFE